MWVGRMKINEKSLNVAGFLHLLWVFGGEVAFIVRCFDFTNSKSWYGGCLVNW